MRFIDINGKMPPEKWSKKAEKHTKALQLLGTHEERMAYIDKYSYIWVRLRNWLEKLSYKKCWYSESRDAFSHLRIEHFRPKGKVVRFNDGVEEIGYWWLAFDWRNYRLCGEVGNSRKWIRFPLKEGSSVATGPNCDLCDEVTYLLDPTNPKDPTLLTFEESGQISPATPEGTWEYERAKMTIEVLFLNFPGLIEVRLDIWRTCYSKIKYVDNLLSKPPNEIDEKSLSEVFDELRKMIDEKATFSATSRACLFKSGRIWARELLR